MYTKAKMELKRYLQMPYCMASQNVGRGLLWRGKGGRPVLENQALTARAAGKSGRFNTAAFERCSRGYGEIFREFYSLLKAKERM
jgi:hypothetical protein